MATPSQLAWRAALGGMFAMAAAMGVGRFVYTPILPFMIDAGVVDAAEAGIVAGANYLGYLAGAIAAAWRYFSRFAYRWAFVALLASVATGALMAATDLVIAMAAIRFVSGFASAFAMIFTTSIVFQYFAAVSRLVLRYLPLWFRYRLQPGSAGRSCGWRAPGWRSWQSVETGCCCPMCHQTRLRFESPLRVSPLRLRHWHS